MDTNLGENRVVLQKLLANCIKKQRLKMNKSISLISAEVGMPKSMWSDMEQVKKDPQLSTLWRISEGLNMTLVELIKNASKGLPENFTLIE